MAATELTPEQVELVERFGVVCHELFGLMARLDAAGIDMRTALERVPSGVEEGQSMYDALPGSLRMML